MSVPGKRRKVQYFIMPVMMVLALALFDAAMGAGSIPLKINYQGYLVDASDVPVTGLVLIRFAIFDDPTGGEELWWESHAAVNVVDGLFKVILGLTKSIPDSVFADTSRYLGIRVGMDPELIPRTRLCSVPYAYRTSSLDKAVGGTVSGNITLVPGDEPSSVVVTGDAGDSVVIDPSKGWALYVTDENGDLRYLLDMEPSTHSASYYDPADVKGPDLLAAGALRVRISNEGIALFGEAVSDTNVFITPEGNVTGRGRLTMGENSTGSANYGTVLGYNNTAAGDTSTISGGHDNVASGLNSIIPGGAKNSAVGNYSIAFGSMAKANHHGSVVIVANYPGLADDSTRSGGDEQLVIRADSGIYITNGGGLAPYVPNRLINTSTGGYLSPGGSWENAGAKNSIENIETVDSRDVLRKVGSLPISEWNYIAEDDRVRHIGPTGEDLHQIFGIGDDDGSISSRDLASIALAAIQQLQRDNEKLKTEVAELRALLSAMQKSNEPGR